MYDNSITNQYYIIFCSSQNWQFVLFNKKYIKHWTVSKQIDTWNINVPTKMVQNEQYYFGSQSHFTGYLHLVASHFNSVLYAYRYRLCVQLKVNKIYYYCSSVGM